VSFAVKVSIGSAKVELMRARHLIRL
jgi:hypothetical protein